MGGRFAANGGGARPMTSGMALSMPPGSTLKGFSGFTPPATGMQPSGATQGFSGYTPPATGQTPYSQQPPSAPNYQSRNQPSALGANYAMDIRSAMTESMPEMVGLLENVPDFQPLYGQARTDAVKKHISENFDPFSDLIRQTLTERGYNPSNQDAFNNQFSSMQASMIPQILKATMAKIGPGSPPRTPMLDPIQAGGEVFDPNTGILTRHSIGQRSDGSLGPVVDQKTWNPYIGNWDSPNSTWSGQ